MTTLAGRVALVTGASSGIGAAIADSLVNHGMKVVGCARNVDKIQEAAQNYQQSNATGSLQAMQCDLSQPDDIMTMFDQIKAMYGGVDVCVNNAGLSHPANLLEGSTQDWKHMLDVNVLGLSICTRETIKSMRERSVDNGHIIHINSLTGHMVLKTSDHMYSATKHAVRALTEGLRQELRGIKSKIRVTEISPGLVNTEFRMRMFPDNPEISEKLYSSSPFLQPLDLANTVLYVLQAPPHVQVHEIIIRPTEAID